MIIEKIEKCLFAIAFLGLLLVGISLVTDTILPGAIGLPVALLAGFTFWIIDVFSPVSKDAQEANK